MGRPVQWLRELPRLRAEAERSRVETWSRQEVERLFGVSRVQAQALMKAVGDLQTVAGAHFLERASLLQFLDELIQAPAPERLLRDRIQGAEPAPRRRPLRVRLPPALRSAMLPDLPPGVRLAPGRIEIQALTAVGVAEALYALALVMQNDDRWRDLVEPPAPAVPQSEKQEQDELEDWLRDLRARHTGPDQGGLPGPLPEKNP